MLAPETPLIGRDGPVAALHKSLEDALVGRGSLVVVSGEAGIGKSSLAAALARDADARGAAITWGRAWELADAPPYFPVWPCLRRLGIALDHDKSDEGHAFHLWEQVLEAMVRTTAERPVVWILEDLHAADLLTLDLLTFLAHPIRAMRVLVVATTRAKDPRLTDRMTQRLTRMARDGLDLRLDPLSAADVAAVAEQCIGRALSPAAVAQLAELTGGNPLFVVECARAYRATGPAGGGIASLPPTVMQVVLERVALLPESARDALACGAILGREFTAASAARMRETLPARTVDALLPALRSGVVSETKPGQFMFSHTLVCEAIADALPAGERAALHARAEAALGALGDSVDILVERARHALLAMEDGEHALGLARRATKLLEEQGAHDRAFALHERIEQARQGGLLAEAATPAERLHVARVAFAAGQHAECRRICAEVVAAARAAGDAVVLGQAALLVGAEIRPAVVDRFLVDLLEEARTALGDASPALGCMLLARLAAALQPAPDPRKPVEMAREAIAKARAIGDDRLVLEVLETAGSALVDFAPLEERIAIASELRDRALAAGDRPKTLRAHVRLSMDHAEAGDFAAFDEDVARMLEVSADLGHPRYRWRPLLVESMRAVTAGDFATSDRCVVEVSQLSALTDAPGLPATLAAHQLLRARLQRRDEELRAWLVDASAWTGDLANAHVVAALIRAASHARMEDVEGAAAALAVVERNREVVEVDPTFRDWIAEAIALCGTDERRRELRDELSRASSDESVGGHVTMTYDGTRGRLIGLLEASLGDHGAAEQRLRAALAKAEQRGHRPLVAQVTYEIGKVLVAAGREAEARKLFDEAARLADELGMPGLATSARTRGNASANANANASSNASSNARANARAALALALEGEVWRVEHGERKVRVRDSRGMRLLARLVERPDEEIHVLALASDEGGAVVETSAGEVIDERARKAYRQRLADLTEDIEEAERNADRGRMDKLAREREALEAELARAVGLGGRSRQSGSATERARVNVQRRIKDAIARVAETDAAIGRILERSVRTGTFCCFRP